MNYLLGALVIALVHCSSATLLIRGSPNPVREGDQFKLECLLKDSEYSIDNVRMEYLHWDNQWVTISNGYARRSCFRFSIKWTQTEDRITRDEDFVTSMTTGAYRCVLDGPNVTAPEYSEQLNVTVHYLYGPELKRNGTAGFYTSSLTVKEGEDVELICGANSSEEPTYTWYKEGDDWLLPSSKLTLTNVSAVDEGRYTCFAEHPTIPSLSKNRTISLTVLSGLQWTLWRLKESIYSIRFVPRTGWNGRDKQLIERRVQPSNFERLDSTFTTMQITIFSTVAFLVVIFTVMAAFFCSCGKKTSKGPIDDHSAKKPIYKSSTESVPSTCGDKQPLV